MKQARDISWVFLILFFCSGATALVYEVVWSKYLSQMFGSTIQAQTVVLAVFMGGLALGNRLLGHWADTLADPVKAYGYLEIAIGLYAFFFATLYGWSDGMFIHFGKDLLDQGWKLTLLKGSLSVLLLLTPTVLMGGTLPLMAAWLNRHSGEGGRRSARFYSVNSLGAVAGAGLAGFFLVKTYGLLASLQATALLNVAIGSLAILLSRPSSRFTAPAGSTEIAVRGGFTPMPMAYACVLVTLTGAVSMGLEILASRSLALIFGSSLQSFAIVLMAFILGIGLGGAAMASPRLRHWQSERMIALLLAGAAAWISLLVLNIESWVTLYRHVKTGLAPTPMGYALNELFAGAMAMTVLGLPAAMIGAVLPLLIRAVSAIAANLGERVGRLLTWNTLGAVAGVLLTGFVLMPQAGLRAAFAILALTLAAVACLTAWKCRDRRGLVLGAGATLLGATLLAFGGDTWRHVMSSGAFRARESRVDPNLMTLRKNHITIAFYEDAPDATISVEHGDGVGVRDEWALRVNGKADASTHGDLSTQFLLSHLPLLARPDSRDVFILGLGSGITAGALLGHPIQSVTVAENCEPVIRAARLFDSWNRGVLTNARARVVCEDARTVLKLSPQTYDVIITQPSNPWTAGIGSVFSREYYELAASRLNPGGLMSQWFHVYEMHDGIVSLVLRTFQSVFPHVEIWDCGSGDIIMMGSLAPWDSGPARFRDGFNRPACRSDMEQLGIRSPEALMARQLASQDTAFAIAGEGPVQTDAFPLLEYEAPRAFFIGQTATLLQDFDERTRQMENCPPEKLQVLQALRREDLEPQFTRFGSMNSELLRAMNQLIAGSEALGDFPCAFSFTGQPRPIRAIPEDVPPEIRELLTACAWIRTDRKREGADKIALMLANRRPDADWAPAHYAAQGVKASLAIPDPDLARRILRLGLDLVPEDEQLLYLARLVEGR